MRPSLDWETYSEAGYTMADGKVKGMSSQGKGGLPVVGTPNYAQHPSTDPLCLYYNLRDGRGEVGWVPGTPWPYDLLDYIYAGGEVEAFNVFFERWIWNEICVKRWGWPTLHLSQCFCVMARSRRQSLPGSLDGVTKVLGTFGKDAAGKGLIQKLCRPNSMTKNRQYYRRTPATDWADFLAIYGYCGDDVKAEDGVSAVIPELTEYERAQWLVDQTINDRGVQVDIESLDAMLDILGQAEEKYTAELTALTGGQVNSVSETAKLRGWALQYCGLKLDDVQKETVAEVLANPPANVHPAAFRALEIRQTLGSANVKKLRTLKLQVSPDGRLRDQYMYCGADRTGRASAGGVQLQNMTAKGPTSMYCRDCQKYCAEGTNCRWCGGADLAATHEPCCTSTKGEWSVESAVHALADIRTRDLALVERLWGDPIDVLCGCLRALFTAATGKILTCCDFSAIEAVVQACLSRCQWRIDVFNTHGKIYEMSASKITGVPFDDIIAHKQQTGQDHKLRKTVGKVAELASGYGGWLGAWKNFGADSFMNDIEMKAAILAWRAESPEIVEMWGGQFRQTGERMSYGYPQLYGLEGAAVAAILNPGQSFEYYDISYHMDNGCLHCVLPSGRHLHYQRARLVAIAGKFGRPGEWKITFEGFNSDTTKGPRGWLVMETYGGRLFENVVQAVAADIQFEALGRLEARGYPVVMHTHDEGSAETDIGQASVDEMVGIMIERPWWASWWPIRADGWQHERYQK